MPSSEPSNIVIRQVQYRDLEVIESLAAEFSKTDQHSCSVTLGRDLQQFKNWYGLLKFLKMLPIPLQQSWRIYVAQEQQIRGLIQVSPFNSTRSTWRVDWVLVDTNAPEATLTAGNKVGSQLLRHCFETIWEARTWLLEVNVNEQKSLALYRQNGFQPLAQMTYWSLAPELLTQLAQQEPDLPNLLPVSNADAHLLYQLDTVSMPPLLRQVFDRHIQDFKTNVFSAALAKVKTRFEKSKVVRGYVFEPQRKAAIGYYCLELCKDSSCPHRAQLTVHPAYTWLYPKLLVQMARIVQDFPLQSLELASADYQPEREEYLEKLGADRIEHTLLMSRSVWHKLRESKPLEGLQWSEVLKSLQPVRTPVPTRMSVFKSILQIPSQLLHPHHSNGSTKPRAKETPEGNNGHKP